MHFDTEKLRNVFQSKIINNIFDTLEEGILIVDRQCRIVFYNKTLSRFEGLESQQVVGKLTFEVFPSIAPEDSTFYQVMQTGESICDRFQQYFNYKGRQLNTVNTTIPIVDDGMIIGALEVSRDISVIVSLTERVAQLQQRSVQCISKKRGGLQFSFENIIGRNQKIRDLIELCKKVSYTTSSVLIYGETGTGKELFAQSIHAAGPRRNKPFIAQNCAAIPENLLEGLLFGATKGSFTGATDKPGLFEQANGGVILLDEINSMSLPLQAKILRVLQEGVVRRLGDSEDTLIDVKIIATTNEKPAEILKTGKLREDLFYRLSVICIEIPALRERTEDIDDLVEHFIAKYNKKFNKCVTGFDQGLLNIMQTYHWPGNIREMEHVVEALMNFADEGEITTEYLKFLSFGAFKNYIDAGLLAISPAAPVRGLNEGLADLERRRIISILQETSGNVAKAAQRMGLRRQSLQYRMKKYNIRKQNIINNYPM